MKRTFLFLALLSFIAVHAQTPAAFDKLDAPLKLWIQDPGAFLQHQPAYFKNGPLADPLISLIFKASGSRVPELVKKHQGQLFSSIGNIFTADIPLSHISAFASESEVIRMESSKEVELHNDKAKQMTGASQVHAGKLPDAGIIYTGKGVIVGIVDSGIDFLHPDFRWQFDSTKTRILSIWDQTINGSLPQGFTYGSEWTESQIQNELSNPGTVAQRDSMGHGTHVSGTAAGLRGMAYDAHIISVKTPLVTTQYYVVGDNRSMPFSYHTQGRAERDHIVGKLFL